MAVSLYTVVIDSHDLPALARFWSQVLNWKVAFEAEDEIVIGADESTLPGITFVPVGERKTVKNRLHIDLTPDDQAAEASEARWGPPGRRLGEDHRARGAAGRRRAGAGRDLGGARRPRGQ